MKLFKSNKIVSMVGRIVTDLMMNCAINLCRCQFNSAGICSYTLQDIIMGKHSISVKDDINDVLFCLYT